MAYDKKLHKGRNVKRIALVLFFFVLLTGCQTMPVVARLSLENAGGFFLYVQPFPKEAERLRFSLEKVSALTTKGEEIPLSLAFKDFNADTLGRQRLLAFVALPPGEYGGLSFRVKNAGLKTQEGIASLIVPEGPVKVDFNFHVERKKAYVIQLALNYGEAINNVTFRPVFLASVPKMPLSGMTGYISNYGSDVVTVFDKKGIEASGAIATGRGPRAVVADRVRFKAYVAISDEDAIEVIDILTGNTINSARIAPGDDPREIALTRDGSMLLTANYGTRTVSFLDASNLVELQRIPVGDGPRSLLIDNSGKKAYVFNSYSNSMSIIDIARRTVVATLPLESSPVRGQFNSKGDRLYVIFSGSPYLVVLDVATLNVVRRAFIGMGAISMKVDTKTDLLYIGNRRDNSVTVYNPFTLTPSYSIRTGGPVGYMTIDGDENNLCLVMPEKNIVSIVNLISRKVVGEIEVAENPQWVSIIGER